MILHIGLLKKIILIKKSLQSKHLFSTYFSFCKALLSNWTLEQISARRKELHPNDPIMTILHEAIYIKPQAV